MTAPLPPQPEIEAAVRRYLARLAGRYLPVLIGVVALALVVVLVPSSSPDQQAQQLLGTSDGGAGTGTAVGGAAGTAPGTTTAQGPAGTVSGPVGAGRSGGTVGSGTATGPGSQVAAGPVAGTGPIGAVSRTGTARNGTRCTPSARQFAFSPYAPPCVAAYSGNNGGATSYGVSRSTITLSYRIGNSASDAAITAATGTAAPPRDADYVKDLQLYIDFFNKQFELYGRKVVLKTFEGKGDYIQEDQGQGADKAQADAGTARGLGAFGDITYQLRGSNPYWSGLAQQKVVAWGPLGFPDSYYQQKAPYWWSYTPSGSDLAQWFGNATCRRLAGLKAIFSADPTIAAKDRKFGLVHPNNPEYEAIADEMKRVFQGCGVKLEKEASYSINVAQFQSQATNVMAQMQAAGVTTLLCYCDPVIPIFLGNAGQSQKYEPEWVQPYWGDPQARQPYGGQWHGVMVPGGQWPEENANEALKVFRLAGGDKPLENQYAAAYATLLQVFQSLQAAGPELTPQNLQRGTFSLPDSTGFAGRWTYRTGAHAFTPVDDAPVGWFDPAYRSAFDGAAGAYRNCESGTRFTYGSAAAWGPPRRQLHCFGT
ncbi:MAG: hypothetical protein LC789_07915 [Actinobacteria bacterium]|nr:hypothetical protein [Actinomycetota bacterium]MCA1719641.1 hypothetical protein [Actinomycetota bacterium]